MKYGGNWINVNEFEKKHIRRNQTRLQFERSALNNMKRSRFINDWACQSAVSAMRGKSKEFEPIICITKRACGM